MCFRFNIIFRDARQREHFEIWQFYMRENNVSFTIYRITLSSLVLIIKEFSLKNHHLTQLRFFQKKVICKPREYIKKIYIDIYITVCIRFNEKEDSSFLLLLSAMNK